MDLLNVPTPQGCSWRPLNEAKTHWTLEQANEEPHLDGFGKQVAEPLGELRPDGQGLTIVRAILPDKQPFDVRRRGNLEQAAQDLVGFLQETNRLRPAPADTL